MRASQAQGMQVVDDATQQIAGLIDQPLIDPDTGRIVGFFVLSAFSGGNLFLQSADIVSWGTRVHILTADKLGPPEDFIRLKERMSDPRTFLGQRILTKATRRSLGILDDVQFNTRHFAVEWLFPRKFFFIRQPIPVGEILEVTEKAVWVKDPIRKAPDLVPKEKPLREPVLPDPIPQVQTRK